MAIAGIVVTGLRERMADVRARMESVSEIAEIRETEDDCRLAAVLETASEKMESALADLKDADGVLAVDLAFLSYEDDLADRGTIGCPPRKPHRRSC